MGLHLKLKPENFVLTYFTPILVHSMPLEAILVHEFPIQLTLLQICGEAEQIIYYILHLLS